MPRDMEKRRIYDEEWKKKNSVKYQLRVSRSSGIPDAVEKLAQSQGKTETTILRDALIEKLQHEGYLLSEGYLPRGGLTSEIKEGLIDNDYIRENL